MGGLVLQSRTVLLVEDNALVGLDAEDMLRLMGARAVIMAHTLASARQSLAGGSVELVVLDFLIGTERSEEFAREVQARGLPLVFASGLASTAQLPDDIRQIPVVTKPYSTASLAAAFAAVGIGIGG